MTSSRRLTRAVVRALALLAVLAFAPERVLFAQPSVRAPTAQDLETARALYKEGKELRARGDLAGALEKLRAAHALGNTPVTGIELARTYVLAGAIVEAREVCLSIARLSVASDETEKSVEARSEAATLAEQLQPRIPTLRVRVEGLGTGERAHLFLDGIAVPDAALGEPQKVDPGKHAVAIRVGAAREARGDADVGEGQAAEVTLTVAAAAAPPAAPPPEPAREPGRPARTGPWLVVLGFGTAVVGGALGVVAGLTAANKTAQLAHECPAKECSSANGGANDLAAAHTWATVSTTAFVVGGVGAVAGILGLVTEKSDQAGHDAAGVSLWVGPSAAGIHGRF
jgi:hypothetical protein